MAHHFVVGPKPVPQTPTDEISGDCWVFEIHLVNDTASAVTVSVYDRQSPPIPLIPPQTMQPGGMLSGDSAPGRLMPGGITWSASGPGVGGYIIGKVRQ